uniref:Uncharacterized protein n=1 Tax=Anguilla anguilla TaxID=7936 RepID=A0A0E9QIP7_ANGAN
MHFAFWSSRFAKGVSTSRGDRDLLTELRCRCGMWEVMNRHVGPYSENENHVPSLYAYHTNMHSLSMKVN